MSTSHARRLPRPVRRKRLGALALAAATLSPVLVVVSAGLAPSPAGAVVRPATFKTVSLEGTFKTANQPLTPTASDLSNALFDERWDERDGGGVGGAGFEVNGSGYTSGRVGMSMEIKGFGGRRVDVDYPVKVDVTMPGDKSFGAGDTIEVSTTEAVVQDGGRIAVSESKINRLGVNATFGLRAGANIEGCAPIVGCDDTDFPLIDIAERSGEILAIGGSQLTGPGGKYCFTSAQSTVLGLGTVPADTGCPAGNGQYRGYVSRPNVALTTTARPGGGLSASGEDRFVLFPFDALTWVKRLTGQSFPSNQNRSVDIGVADVELKATTVDLSVRAAVSQREELAFTPKVDVTLDFPQAVGYRVVTPAGVEVARGFGRSATLRSGNKVLVDVPTSLTTPFTVQPRLALAQSELSNKVVHRVSGQLGLEALELRFEIDFGAGIDFGFSIGPIFREEYDLGGTNYVVHDSTATLGGFNSPTTQPLQLVPAPPPVVTPVTFRSVEGSPTTATVATFTDEVTKAVPADYVARITWGDGSPTTTGVITGSGGSYAIAGTHTYEQYGTYPVRVDLRTVPAGQLATNRVVTATSAVVADAALTGTGLTNNETASGQPVLTWPNPSPAAPDDAVASFADANPFGLLSDLSATIDWGDGTPVTAGTVSGPVGGPFVVSGRHDYTDLGLHEVTVTLTSKGGSVGTATTTTLSYANPERGTFLLGSGRATGAVTYWGAQWAKANALPPAASAVKGFANQAPPACGTTWAADPATGNSVVPPTTVPSFMAVAVTSRVDRAGARASGPTDAVVVVQTNPGYGASPGKTGTGTVVAVLCGRTG